MPPAATHHTVTTAAALCSCRSLVACQSLKAKLGNATRAVCVLFCGALTLLHLYPIFNSSTQQQGIVSATEPDWKWYAYSEHTGLLKATAV